MTARIIAQVYLRRRGSAVHAAERRLVTYTETSTSLYRTNTLCRPTERVASWRQEGEQTHGPVTCGNCARIIAKAEADAHHMNAKGDTVARPAARNALTPGDRVRLLAGDERGGWGIVQRVVAPAEILVAPYGGSDVRVFERRELRRIL
jgi:hypothetical protein